MKIRTHYDNLQLSRNASSEVIRAAYKTLAHRYHPDRNADDRERCERIMRVVNEAHAVLSDPQKRAEHDAWIASTETAAESPGITASASETSSSKRNASDEYAAAADAWRTSRQSRGEAARKPEPVDAAALAGRNDNDSASVSTLANDSKPMSALTGLAIAFGLVIAAIFAMRWWGDSARPVLYGIGILIGVVGILAVAVHITKLRDKGNEAAAADELGMLLTLLAWGWMPLAANAGSLGSVLTVENLVVLTGAYVPASMAAKALLSRTAPDLRWAEVAGYLLLMVVIFVLARIFLAPAPSGYMAPQNGTNPTNFLIVTLGVVLWTVFLTGVCVASTALIAVIDRLRGKKAAKPRAIGFLIGWSAMPALVLAVFYANMLD